MEGGNSNWAYAMQWIGGITANTDYTAGMWIKGDGGINLKILNGSWGNIANKVYYGTDVWRYVTFDFNTGGASGTIGFSLYDNAGSPGIMYIDDVTLIQKDTGINLISNSDFEKKLSNWSGNLKTVFKYYKDMSQTPGQQYFGINNLGVYSWDRNPDGITDFSEWVGRDAYLAEDFLEQSSWSDLEGGNRLAAWSETQYADKMILAAYPYPKDQGSLAEAASGAYNDHYRQLGENLIAAGMSNAIIRFGHEFNGSWYYWSVGNENNADHEQKCADYAEAFRQFVTTLRSIDGANFKFCWNPSTSVWGVDLEACYPGNDYVDFIGIDHYDQTWATSNGSYIYSTDYSNADDTEKLRRQQLAWEAELNDGNWGLQMIDDFADEMGVPVGICEWGLALRSDGMGGGDNPYFIEKMHEWISENNVAWHVYFNVSAGDGDHDLYDTVLFPDASAKFSELFNPNGTPTTVPAIAPETIDGISEDYVKVEAEDGFLFGSNFRFHGDPWASDGELAVMYRSVNTLEFTNCNQAGGIAIVYQGWQSDQSASLYVNNRLVKKQILFEEHGRSWKNSYGYIVLDNIDIPEGADIKIQIDPGDELDNWDSLKLDYILLLGATGEYSRTENPTGPVIDPYAVVEIPSRTSYTRSGHLALTADISGNGSLDGVTYKEQPTLEAGKAYTFGAWIKGSGTMALIIQDTVNGNEILASTFDATDEWEYVETSYTPTVTGIYNIKIGERDTSGSSGRIYIDDVRLAPVFGGTAIIDEDFEDGGSAWWYEDAFSTVDYQTSFNANTHSGIWSMKVNPSADTQWMETRIQPDISLKADKTYTFKLWVKGNAEFAIQMQDTTNWTNLFYNVFTTTSGDWEEISFTFKANVTGGHMLKIINRSNDGELYLDDFLLNETDGNNLIPNCDFELGGDNWSQNSAFTIVKFEEEI